MCLIRVVDEVCRTPALQNRVCVCVCVCVTRFNQLKSTDFLSVSVSKWHFHHGADVSKSSLLSIYAVVVFIVILYEIK